MIYTLDRNTDHITEEGVHDARLIEFEGWQNASFGNPRIDYSTRAPSPVEFVGNLDQLALTDYPALSKNLPVMSWKLLMTLLSVAPFEYRTYPTRIYSEAIADRVRDPGWSTRTDHAVTDPALYTDRFVIVQLLNYTDVLDKERTIYAELVGDHREPRRASESEDGYLNEFEIERLVLTQPEDALPGLFRFPETFSLLCTDRSVQACQAAGIVGVRFTPIPVPLYGGERLLPAELLPQ